MFQVSIYCKDFGRTNRGKRDNIAFWEELTSIVNSLEVIQCYNPRKYGIGTVCYRLFPRNLRSDVSRWGCMKIPGLFSGVAWDGGARAKNKIYVPSTSKKTLMCRNVLYVYYF